VNTELRDRTYANSKPVIRHVPLATELITEQKMERRSIERETREEPTRRLYSDISPRIQSAEAEHVCYRITSRGARFMQ